MYRTVLLVLVGLLSQSGLSVPVQKFDPSLEEEILEVEPLEVAEIHDNATNSTKDLFIIRTVIYEIGVLTDAGNDTDFDNKTHEQIDLSFFDPDSNDTFVDLSNIPIPVQTNVSGVSITGIIPANFGNLALTEEGKPNLENSSLPLFPNKQVKVTHNYTTYDSDKASSILELLGLKHPDRSEEWEKRLETVDTEEIE
ncbi:unnamed protein product [Phyllotreta striolata]|uniref:Uncharacterized protein n=1 Tax=Phyllotreta striolata TaxID=444603 RepID=A0A9N9XK78_PHYSR|nr:unnamed protein product [Phyllotreta striolata]